MRRRFTRRFAGFRRSKTKYQWVREALNVVAPANPDNQDLLAQFRAQFAISANLPGSTLERLHIKINLEMTQPGQGTNNGAFIACWVDSINQTILAAATRPYDQQFLIFDEAFIGEALQQGAVTPFYVVKTYDVRARRKISNIQDTVWLQVGPQGTAVLVAYTVILSMLIRLH